MLMNKQEVLETFRNNVDVPALKAAFPDIEFAISELEDGQQEIIIRVQGEDPDLRPAADIAKLNNLKATIAHKSGDGRRVWNPALTALGITTPIRLKKYKRRGIKARKNRRDKAVFKRIKLLAVEAGIAPRRLIRLLKNHIPMEIE